MSVPDGLGEHGRALWAAIAEGMPEEWELDEREAAILALAAGQADDVAALEAVVEAEGPTAEGSRGQPVAHPALVELRHGRLAVARLLAQLGLPDVEEEARSESSRRAQKAARARWGRRDQLADRRRRIASGAS